MDYTKLVEKYLSFEFPNSALKSVKNVYKREVKLHPLGEMYISQQYVSICFIRENIKADLDVISEEIPSYVLDLYKFDSLVGFKYCKGCKYIHIIENIEDHYYSVITHIDECVMSVSEIAHFIYRYKLEYHKL